MSDFRGKRVSASHKALLDEAERRGIVSAINSGRRSMADQWRLVREKGVYHPTRNPDGAALPSPNAPHIWVGRENHAIDADAPQPVGRLAAFYRDMGVPVSFEVSTEAWHFRPPDERALIHAAGSLRDIRGLLATLRPGMRHQDVRYARTLLRRHGALPAGPNRTPVYGVAMRAAAKRFQASRKLTPDAVIGPVTWKALKAPEPSAKPQGPRRTSERGVQLIRAREGERLEPYNDSAGNATIGVGHLIHHGPVTDEDRARFASFTAADSEALLRRDLARFEAAVAHAVKVPLADHEHAALVSFAFNVGEDGFAGSTVVKRLNAGDRKGAADALLMWSRPPEVLPRRRGERLQFLGSRMVARA